MAATKCALVDQAVLKREQSELEMAVSGGGHGEAPKSGGRWVQAPASGRPRDHVASGRLSQVRHAFASVPREVIGRRLLSRNRDGRNQAGHFYCVKAGHLYCRTSRPGSSPLPTRQRAITVSGSTALIGILQDRRGLI